MNIFCLDLCPKQSAQWLVDSHCVKMVLESAQMLANCFPDDILKELTCPKTKKNTDRKHSYFNHPCSIWVRESKFNMQWLIDHAKEIDKERIIRFNSDSPHFSIEFILWCENNIHRANVPNGPRTKFALAMPDEYKRHCPIESYRNYYKFGKTHLHKWKRNQPFWIENI